MNTLSDEVGPLREAAKQTAILLDVDGTLAPIVNRPADARLPQETQTLLAQLRDRYALLAAVSGRQALAARRVVGRDDIYYVGAHGAELLNPGEDEPQLDPELTAWSGQIKTFTAKVVRERLRNVEIRVEDKDVITAFHWRAAADVQNARAYLEEVAREAEDEGLWIHWGRKVLEIRPPVKIGKGIGVRRLLEEHSVTNALYAGDDTTDLDAFAVLRELEQTGTLTNAITVGVDSDEAPAAIGSEADIVVDGPEGVAELLAGLLG